MQHFCDDSASRMGRLTMRRPSELSGHKKLDTRKDFSFKKLDKSGKLIVATIQPPVCRGVSSHQSLRFTCRRACGVSLGPTETLNPNLMRIPLTDLGATSESRNACVLQCVAVCCSVTHCNTLQHTGIAGLTSGSQISEWYTHQETMTGLAVHKAHTVIGRQSSL